MTAALGHPTASGVLGVRGWDGRRWAARAVEMLRYDASQSPTPPWLRFPLPTSWGIDLYLVDESIHPTGSLKHRLSRALFLHGVCDGRISSMTTIVEASSGSTAVSEAYHANLLGLEFVAVMPAGTSVEKIELISRHGGICHLVDDPAEVVAAARGLAERRGGYFMDQFTNAERVSDWRTDGIAAAIGEHLIRENIAEPQWIVVGAGTGGTAATIGRHLRYRGAGTKLCVVDPENSVYYNAWRTGDHTVTRTGGSRIEGIGRPAVARSFRPGLIDLMLTVPDPASVAAMRETAALLGRRVGGSTGTNVWGALRLICRMLRRGHRGTVVTLLCDSGDRYGSTYYNDSWLANEGLTLAPFTTTIREFLTTATWQDPT